MTAPKPKFDWFQTEDAVTLTLLRKGVVLSDCRVTFRDGNMTVSAGDEVLFEGILAGGVDEKNMQLSCTPAKVEVRMSKTSSGRWPTLTCTERTPPPTVSFAKKNWDAIEREAKQEEENEQLEGDAAVNRMFQKIYADASDDVKKAMMKSYSESGGTVLSTNWAEISKKKTEVKPPDCMEYKKFN